MVTVSVRRRPCSSRARVSAPGMTIVALSALPRTLLHFILNWYTTGKM